VTHLATVDERERVRATRVEVARLLALPYRLKLTDDEFRQRDYLLTQHVSTLPLADRESFAEHGQHDMDWSILDEPGVSKTVELAVRAVVRQYGEKLSATEDDLTQSARIILAERAEQARELKAKGYLWRFVYSKLAQLIQYEHRDGSLDGMAEADGTVL